MQTKYPKDRRRLGADCGRKYLPEDDWSIKRSLRSSINMSKWNKKAHFR